MTRRQFDKLCDQDPEALGEIAEKLRDECGLHGKFWLKRPRGAHGFRRICELVV